MKKILFSVLAMAAFAACSNEEQIAAPKGQAIAFGDAFVDNATKAIYDDADDIKGFTVFGNVAAKVAEGETPNYVALYGNGAAVTRGDANLGAAWTCNVVRYWTPSCLYNFAAIANGDVAANDIENGLPTKISYTANAADPKDLIYATALATTDESGAPSITSGIVAFSFEHLLSRVKVSFLNSRNSSDYRYVISDVKIVAGTAGTLTIGSAWNNVTTGNLACNSIEALGYSTTATLSGTQLVIPGTEVKVSFDYQEQLKVGESWSTINTVNDKVLTITTTPVKNNSYNATVQFTAGNQINFTVAATGGLVDFANDSNVTVQ